MISEDSSSTTVDEEPFDPFDPQEEDIPEAPPVRSTTPTPGLSSVDDSDSSDSGDIADVDDVEVKDAEPRLVTESESEALVASPDTPVTTDPADWRLANYAGPIDVSKESNREYWQKRALAGTYRGSPPEHMPKLPPEPIAAVTRYEVTLPTSYDVLETANGEPTVVQGKDGEKYYLPASTMYKLGFRTEREHLRAQQSGLTLGAHDGEWVPDDTVILGYGDTAQRFRLADIGAGQSLAQIGRGNIRYPVIGGDAEGKAKEFLLTRDMAVKLGSLQGEEQFQAAQRLGLYPKDAKYIPGSLGVAATWLTGDAAKAEQEAKARLAEAKAKYAARIALEDKVATFRVTPGDIGTGEGASYRVMDIVDSGVLSNEELRELFGVRGAVEAVVDAQRRRASNTKLVDGQWISNQDLEAIRSTNSAQYDTLVKEGFAAYERKFAAASKLLKGYDAPEGYPIEDILLERDPKLSAAAEYLFTDDVLSTAKHNIMPGITMGKPDYTPTRGAGGEAFTRMDLVDFKRAREGIDIIPAAPEILASSARVTSSAPLGPGPTFKVDSAVPVLAGMWGSAFVEPTPVGEVIAGLATIGLVTTFAISQREELAKILPALKDAVQRFYDEYGRSPTVEDMAVPAEGGLNIVPQASLKGQLAIPPVRPSAVVTPGTALVPPQLRSPTESIRSDTRVELSVPPTVGTLKQLGDDSTLPPLTTEPYDIVPGIGQVPREPTLGERISTPRLRKAEDYYMRAAELQQVKVVEAAREASRVLPRRSVITLPVNPNKVLRDAIIAGQQKRVDKIFDDARANIAAAKLRKEISDAKAAEVIAAIDRYKATRASQDRLNIAWAEWQASRTVAPRAPTQAQRELMIRRNVEAQERITADLRRGKMRELVEKAKADEARIRELAEKSLAAVQPKGTTDVQPITETETKHSLELARATETAYKAALSLVSITLLSQLSLEQVLSRVRQVAEAALSTTTLTANEQEVLAAIVTDEATEVLEDTSTQAIVDAATATTTDAATAIDTATTTAAETATRTATDSATAIDTRTTTRTDARTATRTDARTATRTDARTAARGAARAAARSGTTAATGGLPPPSGPIPRVPPPPPPFYPSEELVGTHDPQRHLASGDIVWLQGIMWKTIPYPYDVSKAISTREPPEGARVGGRTPEETIQVIGGPVAVDVDIDLGWTDIHIEAGTEMIQFSSARGLRTDVGDRIVGNTRGITVDRLANEEAMQAQELGELKKRRTQRSRVELATESEIAAAVTSSVITEVL